MSDTMKHIPELKKLEEHDLIRVSYYDVTEFGRKALHEIDALMPDEFEFWGEVYLIDWELDMLWITMEAGVEEAKVAVIPMSWVTEIEWLDKVVK